MGIMNWLENKFVERRAKRAGGSNFDAWFKPYNMFERMSGHRLANNEIIFSAVTKISNAMASMPLKIYRDSRHQPGHRLGVLMGTAPNAAMTSHAFIQTMEVLRSVHGNAYAIKRLDRYGAVEAVDVLDPTRVEPVQDDGGGELYYRVVGPRDTFYLHNLDVIHVKHISTGYKGISPIDVLRGSIDYDNEIRKINIDGMRNVIKASFELQLGTNVSEEKKAEIKQNFEAFYSNNGGVILTEAGMKLNPLESELIDPKVFEAEKITRSRVALVFGLPPHMFGEAGNGNREGRAIGFAQDTLLPIARQYEQEFDRKLLTPGELAEGYTFKFSMSGFLRADTATRGAFYQRAVRGGFMTPNEIRELEDAPPLPGGDRLFVSRDMVPIEQAGTKK